MSGALSVIVAGDPANTRRVLDAVVSAARASGESVALVQLVPVGNVVLLGDPHAYWSLTVPQQELLDECIAAADALGVRARVYAMQTVDFRGAVLDLIDMLQPRTAYIQPPARGPSCWRRWRLATLKAAAARRGCMLVPYRMAPDAIAAQSPAVDTPATART
jgi:hypothetical protein